MIDGVRKKTGIRSIAPVMDVRPHTVEKERKAPSKERLSFHTLEENRTRGKWIMWLIVSIIVAVAFFVVGWKTRSATVSLTSFSEEFQINKQVGVADKTTPGFLHIETVRIPFDYNPDQAAQSTIPQEKEIDTTPKPEDAWYAIGTVRVFNTTPSPVNLRIQTRFQNPDGQIFFSGKALTVPAGTKEKPGTAEAPIRSAEKLSQINTTLDDFILPGLPEVKQKSIFGRSVVALAKDPNQENVGAAVASKVETAPQNAAALAVIHSPAFQTWFFEQFLQRESERFPGNFEVLRGNEQYEGIETAYENGAKGTVTVLLVEKTEFASLLSDEIARAQNKGKDAIVIDDSKSVRVSPITSGAVMLSGSVLYHIETPKENLETVLLGSRPSAFSGSMQNFPWLKAATLSVRPWWVPKLPSNPEKLTITFTKD